MTVLECFNNMINKPISKFKEKNIIQPTMKLSRPCQIFKIQHPRVKVTIMWIPFKECSFRTPIYIRIYAFMLV